MNLRCPQCKRRLIEKSGDAAIVRSQGKIVFLPDGTCSAQCFFCKSQVELPLELSKSTDAAPRIVVPVRRAGG